MNYENEQPLQGSRRAMTGEMADPRRDSCLQLSHNQRRLDAGAESCKPTMTGIKSNQLSNYLYIIK